LADTQVDPEVRQALGELQRYLSDQVAPLMVADSIELLIGCPPALVAESVEAWVASQYRGASDDASMTDYLFHAMKKINLMAQLRLIDPERMKPYVDALSRIVVEICPSEDRDSFRATLKGLGQADTEVPPSVQLMRAGAAAAQQGMKPARDSRGAASVKGAKGTAGATGAGGAAGTISEEVERGLKRFSLLLKRLEQEPPSTPAAGASEAAKVATPRAELMTQILTTAALNSRSGTDLDQYMQRLSQMGIDAKTDQVFRALGRSLPGWLLPTAMEGAGPSPASTTRPAEAMRRLVSMAGSPVEGVKRFSEMVQAAIEQFNDGQLPKAAAMFEVADRLVTDKKVDPERSKLVRERSHEALSVEQLRAMAEKPEKHASLRRVLNFFPALSVSGLMTDLDGEEKRDRRKLLLALLEAQGLAAREATLKKLEERLASGHLEPHGYFTRNLVFLLRRIPKPVDDTSDREAALLGHLLKWGNPLIVIKEAIGALGQIRGATAEQALIARLKEYESMLLQGGGATQDDDEIEVLLDRIASALVRMGTPNAWRTVVNHALQKEPALGNTMARLVDLGTQDLAPDKELADHLVATLRGELPKKVLGFVVQKKNENAINLVQSISGTQTAAVKQVLQEIVERFPDQEFSRLASKALTSFGSPARATEAAAMTLSGDLDLFGLPSLLQTVADARMSGLLTLTGREGKSMAGIEFESGKVRACHTGSLTGEVAFYQLFERPLPGTFLFKSRREGAAEAGKGAEAGEGLFEVLPAMLEAMRRHDEFQQAKAIAPDDASMKATGVKPTGPSEGEEPAFLRAVWAQAGAGATPLACEEAVPADCYRIRRLYALWVEQGALQQK
jgi:hypothetical protein